MNCVGYHITVEGIIANSDGGFVKESPYLDFLLQPKPDNIKVFYHLNHAVACLCRTLGFTEEQCRKLHDKGSLHLPPYDLKYVPAKFFSVRSNIVQSNGDRPFANFSDMSQYFEWSLDGKCDLPDCTAKAYAAKDVGERVLDAAHKLGLKPTALTSPIRMFEKEILGKYDEKGRAKPKGIDFPVVADLPDDVKEDLADYAYRCCHGGWNECFIKGHFDAWDYDINSAYPHYMSHLLDWRYGEWHETDEYVQSPFYSFWKGEAEMTANFHPIIWSQTYDMGYTPTGRWPCYVTGLEVEFIRKYGLGEFHCEHGFYWLPHKQVKPFLTVMRWLWNVKEQAKGLLRDFAKRISTGIWGKMGEVRHDGTMGAHFEPVMHAWVEAQTRLEVARFVLDNDLTEHVLSIAVDGVLADCPVELGY